MGAWTSAWKEGKFRPFPFAGSPTDANSTLNDHTIGGNGAGSVSLTFNRTRAWTGIDDGAHWPVPLTTPDGYHLKVDDVFVFGAYIEALAWPSAGKAPVGLVVCDNIDPTSATCLHAWGLVYDAGRRMWADDDSPALTTSAVDASMAYCLAGGIIGGSRFWRSGASGHQSDWTPSGNKSPTGSAATGTHWYVMAAIAADDTSTGTDTASVLMKYFVSGPLL